MANTNSILTVVANASTARKGERCTGERPVRQKRTNDDFCQLYAHVLYGPARSSQHCPNSSGTAAWSYINLLPNDSRDGSIMKKWRRCIVPLALSHSVSCFSDIGKPKPNYCAVYIVPDCLSVEG